MKKFLIVLFVLALSISSQANIISYTDSITGLFDLVETRDLLIPQFDSSLGTLNSVTVNFSTAIAGSVGFENLKRFAGGNLAITVNTHGYVVIDNALMSNFLDQQTYNTTLAAYDGTLDYAGTSGKSLATYSDADTIQYTLTSGFDRFLGISNIIFPILAEAVADYISKPSNSSVDFTTTGQASVAVTYDFTPIPEPATIAILTISGLLLRWKRA